MRLSNPFRLFATVPLVLLFLTLTPTLPAIAKEKETRDKVYDIPVDRVYAAMVRVASARYNLKSAIKEAYLVNFFTGGAGSLVMSATCHDHDGGKTIVMLSVTASERSPQLFFLGKTYDNAAKHFWSNLEWELNTDQKLDGQGSVTTPTSTEASQQLQSKAAVAITSVPTGAEIFVDQDFVGNTPSSISVSTGKHTISVRKPGYKYWERALVVSGGTVNLDAELTPGSNPSVADSIPAEKPLEASTSSSSVVERGWIGVSTTNDTRAGMKVTGVVPGSPAAQAGLRVGDVISKIDDRTVTSDDVLEVEIARYKPGSQVKLRYMRTSWLSDMTVTVGSRRD